MRHFFLFIVAAFAVACSWRPFGLWGDDDDTAAAQSAGDAVDARGATHVPCDPTRATVRDGTAMVLVMLSDAGPAESWFVENVLEGTSGECVVAQGPHAGTQVPIGCLASQPGVQLPDAACPVVRECLWRIFEDGSSTACGSAPAAEPAIAAASPAPAAEPAPQASAQTAAGAQAVTLLPLAPGQDYVASAALAMANQNAGAIDKNAGAIARLVAVVRELGEKIDALTARVDAVHPPSAARAAAPTS